MANQSKQVALLIQDLYTIVKKLEKAFPGRPFTPDGHLVGSIGEVLAAYHYGLELQTPSKSFDALAANGKKVEIKATQKDRIAMRSEPEFLLVLKILENGEAVEMYNGPGKIVWDNAGPMQSNGQRTVSINKLKKLEAGIPDSLKLQKVKRDNLYNRI